MATVAAAASAAAAATATRDPNTLSNYGHWRTRHVSTDFRIDFDARRLLGSAELLLESLTDRDSDEIVLDTSYLDIASVTVDGAPAQWKLGAREGPYGEPLRVTVPAGGAARGATLRVRAEVATTDRCTALQWLTPAQTGADRGRQPYVYSQCQAIHARSLFPCQDTPDVKATMSFRIASRLPVVASGIAEEDEKEEAGPGGRTRSDRDPGDEAGAGGDRVYRLEQRVPIPSYLFALASGDIATAPIGPRSLVATSPDRLAAAQWEFEADMERFIEAAERIVGQPYRWGQYNVLVLPPSFPYGGMENPIYTFATPTLLSGDRQNVDVIAHELSHSWSGNLVTSCSWEHFWLNEGWTMYLERRIQAEVHGPAMFDFSAIIGWKSLEDSVRQAGPDHEFTKLIIGHRGIDPDDAFSTVPYEKGFHMLYYLDRTVGRANFDRFIKHYFAKWSGRSLDSFEFRDTFLDFFAGIEDASVRDAIAAVDWDSRFYSPGLPPKPDLDTSLADQCYSLARRWEREPDDGSFAPRPDDVADFSANQKLVFLEALQAISSPLSPGRARLLGEVYDLAGSRNTELKSGYYLIALRSRDETAYKGAAVLAGQTGRMKYVRPLYRALVGVDPDLARRTFEEHEQFYHPICRAMLAKDLGV